MSYSPSDTHSERFKEEAWLQGSLLSCLVYGVELTLFAVCTNYLVSAKRSDTRPTRTNQVYRLYTTTVFLIGTLFMAASAKYLDLAYIQNRNYPGGPSAFQDAMLSVPIARLGNIAFVTTNWLASALMIWRCSVIYAGCECPVWKVLCVPCFLFGLSVTLGTLWLVQVSDMLFPHTNYILIYLSISLGLAAALAAIIVGRIFVIRRIATRTFGHGHRSQFTSILALSIESSSLYCVFCFLCLITLASRSPVSRIFLQSLGHIQIVATFLIIFRETQGNSWTTGTVTQIMNPVVSNNFKMVTFSANRDANGPPDLQEGVIFTREVCKINGNTSGGALQD